MWTQFMDMHSGGSQKLDWPHIYIEAPEYEAVSVFYSRFHRNPNSVTCTCCGEDYAIFFTDKPLEYATAYERGCRYGYVNKDGAEVSEEEARSGLGAVGKYFEERGSWKEHRTLEEFLQSGECLVIRAEEITDEERRSVVPTEERHVWVD